MQVTLVTDADLQAAFARVRGDGWPTSLHELQQAAARLAIVTGAAQALARGERVLAREQQHPGPGTTTEPPVHTFKPIARHPGTRLNPARHHGDAVDLKRLASGDRDD